MRAVLSLVKSLGDLPNVLYVLALDETVVKKALGESADKIDPSFLEKIVQVSLKLPPPWRNEMRQLLFERLNAIVGDAKPADEQRWRRILFRAIDPYLETPRDVTRLVNTLQVIWPNVKGDVDLADLIMLTTLQLFDQDVYALVRDEVEVITHADYRYEDGANFAERMVPKNARRPDVAKEAMALMFPRLAAAWKSVMADGAYYVVQKEERRICTKEYHRNYFVFGRNPRMLRRDEVEEIVTVPDPAPVLSATLRRLVDEPVKTQPSRVATLLEQISEAVYAKPLLTPSLLRGLLDHSDELVRREDETWEFYVTHNINRLGTIIRLGLDKLDNGKREEILRVLVEHSAGLQIRADIVEGDALRHGYFGGSKQQKSDPLFPADKVKDAALSIKEQIAEACARGAIWEAPLPVRLIWSWKQMDGGQQLEDWMRKAIADDDLVVRIANELPGRSYQSGGRHGTRIVWTFRREQWKNLLDVEELFRRLETLSSTNEDAASALKRLHEAERTDKD